jgi:hypothetical protein
MKNCKEIEKKISRLERRIKKTNEEPNEINELLGLYEELMVNITPKEEAQLNAEVLTWYKEKLENEQRN